MKEAFSNINQKERRQLAGAAALLGLILIFLVFGVGSMRRSCRKSVEILALADKDMAAAGESLGRTEAEWERWEQASRDMADLQEKFFYSADEWLKPVRLDLQRLLDDSSILHSQKNFLYTHFEGEGISKVDIEFNVTGSYNSLKAFIQSVESLPRFLMIERIDFLEIDPQGARIKLRVILAGYHAQF